MDLLEVKNISKTYGTGEATVHALKKATFSVPKGEFVAIVGESGSGKSTLLNMIGALDTPTSGKVFIDGKDNLCKGDPEPDHRLIWQGQYNEGSTSCSLSSNERRWNTNWKVITGLSRT